MQPHKTYPSEKSPFYKLRNKRKLASLLGINFSDLDYLSNDRFYWVYPRREKEKSDRTIEEPKGKLRRVHKRFFNLLKRIKTPDFLFSGKKGLSYINNAEYHRDNSYFLCVDIKQFYPSSNIEYVFRFFRYKMLMSEDAAWSIAKVVTYNDHVPTGSHLSQLIAYWSFEKLFNDVFALASRNGVRFSLYVDDMTFSSTGPFPRNFHVLINGRLKRVGLKLKRSKIHYRSGIQYKIVTGCAISPTHELKVPNKLRHKIIESMQESNGKEDMLRKQIRSLLGRVGSARKIEPNIFREIFRVLKERDRLVT